MSRAEKENRINSLAVTFLERQQIIPNPLADQIISAYKEEYNQAEKDLELTWEDINIIRQIIFDYNRQIRNEMSIPNDKEYCKEVLKRFKERKEIKD